MVSCADLTATAAAAAAAAVAAHQRLLLAPT
jgi:hypothetical protein